MAHFKWGDTPYTIVNPNGDLHHIIIKGRNNWALMNLLNAGLMGCTPLDNPAPRWSAYVFNLREMGVWIDTIHEPHGGDFSGLHGRYVLRSCVLPGHREVKQ